MIVYRGSTKEIRKKKENLIFKFTDDYSIYDYGKMPNSIPNKGKYLAKMATNWFQILENPDSFKDLKTPPFCLETLDTNLLSELVFNGAKTHFVAPISKREIEVQAFKVAQAERIDGSFDYSFFETKPENTTIPLECIFRFGAPLGSSLLDHDSNLLPNTYFEEIQVEFSTKLEPKDRKLSLEEAITIAGLSSKEINQLISLVKIYASLLWKTFNSKGLELWDGKFEFAFGKKNLKSEREIVLIDSIGPDELRLTYKNLPLSKEFLRQLYRDTKWYRSWTSGERKTPKKLSHKKISAAKEIYKQLSLIFETDSFSLPKKTEKLIKDYNQHVVVLGKGAREHALARSLAASPKVKQVTVIPGNPGMREHKIYPQEVQPQNWIEFCKYSEVSYVVIGPEDLITEGWADKFQSHNIPCLAPTQKASLLESSKAYSKTFMRKYKIPTADFKVFEDQENAYKYIQDSNNEKFVIKKSGLAAGKGVFICEDKSTALDAITQIQDNKIIVEELLEGPEVSYFVLCNKENFTTLGTACDYKRLLDGNKGPNTGGMGCYSPARWLSKKDIKKIEDKIIAPTLKGMVKEKRAFSGVLFVGLMKTKSGFKVLEYNVRFGDPETQTILPTLKESIHEVCVAAINNTFKKIKIKKSKYNSVHLVKASKDYPFSVTTPTKIENNFISNSKAQLFFAGVKKEDNQLLSSGGRILGITCLDENQGQARLKLYQKALEIKFQGEQYRQDIGL